MPEQPYEVWMTALRRGKLDYTRASLHSTFEAAKEDAIARLKGEAHTYLKAEVLKDDGVVWGGMSHRQHSVPGARRSWLRRVTNAQD